MRRWFSPSHNDRRPPPPNRAQAGPLRATQRVRRNALLRPRERARGALGGPVYAVLICRSASPRCPAGRSDRRQVLDALNRVWKYWRSEQHRVEKEAGCVIAIFVRR
jgi:hypothetical protein